MRPVTDAAAAWTQEALDKFNLDRVNDARSNYVEALVDRFGLSLCCFCLDGLLPPRWTSGLAVEGTPRDPQGVLPRCWWFEKPLTHEQRASLLDYFERPKCTPARHAAHEARVLAEKAASFDAARIAFEEASARTPGWSVDK